MVGVQGVGDVENFRGALRGCFTSDEVKEMRGFREVGADGRKFEALAEAMEGRNDDGSFRNERNGDERIRGHIRFADGGAFVIEAEHGNAGAQDVHGIGIARGGLEEIKHALGQFALTAEFLFHGSELRAIRQVSMVKEVGHLLKRAVFYQLIDAIAEVAEPSLRAFDVG